jgi:uncharacterized repeat protein (TIGR01451 family)
MNARTPLKSLLRVSLLLVALALAVQTAQPANVLFVSDNPTNANNAFHPGIVGWPDDFYVMMLTNAGHNVIRFNPPDATPLLTAAQLTAINTNDLIVVSRSIGSGAFVNAQASNWNVRVTKPLIMTSPYLVRLDGNRLSWFTNGNGDLPDTTPPTRMRAMDVSDPETAFLFEDVLMNGNTMVDSFDEANEQNTSTITNAPTVGGKQLAIATFPRLNNGVIVTANIITEFPAGTVVGTSGHLLGGYRMFFAAGTREIGATGIPLGAGRDNLTPAGEKIFMRAVALALNNGVVPADTSPVGIVSGPTNVTVVENTPVSFSLVVTGAVPRLAQWERDIGDGTTFTNIPGGTTPFGQTIMAFPPLKVADDGALVRVVATNAFGATTSEVARLTVLRDTTPPTIIAIRAKWTLTNIVLTFSEPLDPITAQEVYNYNFVESGIFVDSVTLDATGTIVSITTTPQVPGTVYTLRVENVLDRAETPNAIAAGTQVSFTALVESRGFLVSELFLNITTPLTSGDDIPTVTGNTNYPHNPHITGYVNVSSNAPTSPNRDNYGGRLVGWLVPPVSGTYTLYIRGDDDTELRLDGIRIAGAPAVTAATSPGSSSVQNLNGGQAYLIEALWREATGGDYMQVSWIPPWSTSIESIAGNSLQTYADPYGVSVSIRDQPVGGTVEENRSFSFLVDAYSEPVGPRSYQWQKGDGAGGFTNAHGAQYGPTFTTPLLKYPDDNGSQWRVIVYVPGGAATSDVATVTVEDDITPPVALSAGSMDGLKVGVCFDEMVDATTGEDLYPYGVFVGDTAATVISAKLRPDRKSVVLTLEPPGIPAGPFRVHVDGVEDLALNVGAGYVLHSTAVGLTGQDMGVPPVLATRGTNWTCEPDVFEVIGGGSDIWAAADTGHFANRSVTGDFDAKVRVQDLTLTGTTGGAIIAKAGLMVRQTIATNSQTLWLLGNPPPPGRDIIEAGYRGTVGGATVGWGNGATNIHMPNMWFRIRRDMNTFGGFVSSNGVDWINVASTNVNRPSSILLGAVVTSHNNAAGMVSTGRFSNFSIIQPVSDLSISQVAPSAAYVGGNVTYTIEVQNGGPDATWNNVVVTIPLPAGSTYVSATPEPEGACSLIGGVVTCEWGPNFLDGTITLVTTVNTVGTTTSTATVSSTAVDPVPANNTSSVQVQVLARPAITNLSYVDGRFSFSIPTANGFEYRLEFKDKLTDPVWSIIAFTPGNGDSQTMVDPGPVSPTGTRFYRIAIE